MFALNGCHLRVITPRKDRIPSGSTNPLKVGSSRRPCVFQCSSYYPRSGKASVPFRGRRTTNTSLFKIKHGSELCSFQSPRRRMGGRKEAHQIWNETANLWWGSVRTFFSVPLLVLRGKETGARGLPIKYKLKKIQWGNVVTTSIYWSKLLFWKSLLSCFCKI